MTKESTVPATKPANKPGEGKPATPPETKPASPPETKGEGLDLQRDEQRATTGEMEQTAQLQPMARKTLRGDLRDGMLAVLKRQMDFPKLLEGEQRDIIAALDTVADAFVDKAFRLFTEEGRMSIAGEVQSINLKEGMKITIQAPYSLEAVGLLADAAGHSVIIMRPKAEQAKGQRKPAKPAKDQGSLIPEDDSDLANAGDGAGSTAEAAMKETAEADRRDKIAGAIVDDLAKE